MKATAYSVDKNQFKAVLYSEKEYLKGKKLNHFKIFLYILRIYIRKK